MSMIKRGSTQSKIVISDTVLICNACGHTLCSSEASLEKVASAVHKCPECGKDMVYVSASAELEESKETDAPAETAEDK